MENTPELLGLGQSVLPSSCAGSDTALLSSLLACIEAGGFSCIHIKGKDGAFSFIEKPHFQNCMS